MTERSAPVTLDVVIPVFNEEDVLDTLIERLNAVFSEKRLREHGLARVRYVMVDDGSTDRSAEIIARAIAQGLSAVLVPRFLRALRRLEAGLVPRPPVGSSLLLAARRP